MVAAKRPIAKGFRPPLVVARAAAKGLRLRERFKRGGTAIGIARARDLKNRRHVSERTIRRMSSYFSRHAVDKRGRNFFNRLRPSNGYIAWLLWGGDEGRKWAEDIKKKLRRGR